MPDFALAATASLPPGSGPRHITFHPSKPFAYVMSELDPSVTTFACADGRLDLLATEQVVPAIPGGSGIIVAPSGGHLLAGDRGGQTIARFAIDPATGIARFATGTPCGGEGPRDLAFSPSATVLAVANVMSNNVALFRHSRDGALTPLASIVTGTPTGVAFA